MTEQNTTREHSVWSGYNRTVAILFVIGALVVLLPLSVNRQQLQDTFANEKRILVSTQPQVFSADDTSTDRDANVVSGDMHESLALELERQKCLDDIRNRFVEDFRPFFENVNTVVLFDVALHKNLGDSVLWRAAIHLVTLFGRTVDYVCAASQAKYKHLRGFPHCNKKHVIELVKDNGLIMYHAGGNWGNLYRGVQLYRMRALRTFGVAFGADNATFKVIQLPQSIHYTRRGERDAAKDDTIINDLPSGMFTLLTRQDDSFVWAQQHYRNNIDIRQSPDIAFALGQLAPIGRPTVDVILVINDFHF